MKKNPYDVGNRVAWLLSVSMIVVGLLSGVVYLATSGMFWWVVGVISVMVALSPLVFRSPKAKKRTKKGPNLNLGEKGQAQLIIPILLIIGCGLLAGAWSFFQGNLPADTTTSGLPMLEPRGANPEKDLVNSESNLNNSQANLYNAQATAVIVDSNGNYILNTANATAIVADSNQGPINAYKDGKSEGVKGAFGLSIVGLVAIASIILLIAAALAR